MARTRTTKAKPAPEPEVEENETNGSAGLRPVGALHEHMADWLNEEYGEELDETLTARQVQVVISKRNQYRKSDEYAEFAEQREQERDRAAEEATAKPKVKRGRPVTTDDAEEDETEEAPKPARRGRVKATETPAEEPAPAKTRTRRTRATAATEEEAAPAPARRSRRRAAPAASETEPF